MNPAIAPNNFSSSSFPPIENRKSLHDFVRPPYLLSESFTLSHWERAGVRATTIEAITLTSILSQRERKKTGNLPESMVHFRRNPKSLALLRFFLESPLP